MAENSFDFLTAKLQHPEPLLHQLGQALTEALVAAAPGAPGGTLKRGLAHYDIIELGAGRWEIGIGDPTILTDDWAQGAPRGVLQAFTDYVRELNADSKSKRREARGPTTRERRRAAKAGRAERARRNRQNYLARREAERRQRQGETLRGFRLEISEAIKKSKFEISQKRLTQIENLGLSLTKFGARKGGLGKRTTRLRALGIYLSTGRAAFRLHKRTLETEFMRQFIEEGFALFAPNLGIRKYEKLTKFYYDLFVKIKK